jgi:predicted DsbA family dithiol-disulfide isomerase
VPFFLEPEYDPSRPFIETNRERLIRKWGGEAGWEEQKKHHNLKGRGEEVGIKHFNLDRLASNTMASHRLIQHIGKHFGLHVSETIYDKLNQYHFVDGHALNDLPRLANVVGKEMEKILPEDKSFTENEILEFLKGDEGKEEIEYARHALQQLGINSIPTFIIDGSIMVGGAASSDVFVKIFREIEERGTVNNGPLLNDVLGVDDATIQMGSHS